MNLNQKIGFTFLLLAICTSSLNAQIKHSFGLEMGSMNDFAPEFQDFNYSDDFIHIPTMEWSRFPSEFTFKSFYQISVKKYDLELGLNYFGVNNRCFYFTEMWGWRQSYVALGFLNLNYGLGYSHTINPNLKFRIGLNLVHMPGLFRQPIVKHGSLDYNYFGEEPYESYYQRTGSVDPLGNDAYVISSNYRGIVAGSVKLSVSKRLKNNLWLTFNFLHNTKFNGPMYYVNYFTKDFNDHRKIAYAKISGKHNSITIGLNYTLPKKELE